MIIDLSNRRNNSCGSTKSTLCKIFYFVKVYFSFFYFKTKDISCDCYERTSCDRRKNTAALWCNHFSIFCNKDEVCSTGLFYFCSCLRIQIHIFSESLIMCIYDRMKTHRIVQTSLNMSRTIWCCTVKITDTDYDRFCAALEIRTNRCRKYTELILFRRSNSDNRCDTEHIWTDVQRSTGAIRWHVSFVCQNSLYYCIYKFIFRKCRHLKTSCRICHTLCI